MRIVWKDVLASLVEGRKPGEETTLWIQRQITNSSGKAELEALHQIPVKWLQDVSFLDYSVDNRFTLRVYNLDEDFVFRCPKDPSAAENWVMTLLSAKEAAVRKKTHTLGNGIRESHRDEKKSAEPIPRANLESQQIPSPVSGPVPTPFEPPPAAAAAAVPRSSPSPQPQATVVPPEAQPPAKKKVSIKELRALAHGAGINTHGMERGELERVVARLSQQHETVSTQPRPTAPHSPPDSQEVANADAERKRQEEEHQRAMAARVHAQQEALRKQKEEEERQRLARERQLREEEEMRQRLAQQEAEKRQREQEEAARREQEEFRRRQEAWQKQQAEQESRRVAEQQRQQEEERRRTAEQQRQHEAYQRNMHWQQSQANSSGPHPQPFPFPGYSQQQGYPPNGFYNIHHQQQQQQQQQAQTQQSKYAKMAAQEDGSSSAQRIKHAILIHWALQPPMRQNLRRIEDLVTSIHTVFPPAFGVPGHDYFQKWSVLAPADVDNDDKLEKKVKKLRFFLHPDKLPKDLSEDQSFMCRMLWDITSDALEEHKTKKEDLSWIHH
jgi:hypothetical protein